MAVNNNHLYTVQSGDNLWKIVKNNSNKELSDAEIVQKLNLILEDEDNSFIENPSNIYAGWQIDLSALFDEQELQELENAKNEAQEEPVEEPAETPEEEQAQVSEEEPQVEESKEEVKKETGEESVETPVDEQAQTEQIESPLQEVQEEPQVEESKEEVKEETGEETGEEINFSTKDYEYSSEELKQKALDMQQKTQANNAVDTRIERNAPSLDENGKVVANQEFYESSVEDGALSGYTVMVNAGHGGFSPDGTSYDPGAVYNNTEEWVINQDYAETLTEKLLDEGADVVLSQGHYKTLIDNVNNFANEYGEGNNENLRLVSIHANASSNENASGVIFYNSDGNNDLIDNLYQSTQQSQDVNLNSISQRNTNVCQAANNDNIANALVEVGFMTNSDDLAKIQTEEYKDALTDSLVDGIISDVEEKKS